ncbi:hypothetical protein [Maritalea sp.]|uniref:hypothetical protein n=1 Tax=Maritalea sp. TaxID=2003361 RepID=UPI003EF2F54D
MAWLLFGLLLGQGAMFLANTWLVMGDKLLELASFGTHFSFLILALLIVDGGCTTVLTRKVALIVHGKTDRHEIAQLFRAAIIVRAGICMLILSAVLAYTLVSNWAFSNAFVICAAPAIIIWVFNSTGVLDGLGLSGASGISTASPYVISALILPIALNLQDAVGGYLLGTAFSLGCLIAVLVQHLVSRRCGLKLLNEEVTSKMVKDIFFTSLASLMSVIPGQIYFRLQLLICFSVLGSGAVGALIYVKQIVTGFLLLTNIARRVEFPDLVREINLSHRIQFSNIISAQRINLSIAIMSTLIAALIGAFSAQSGSSAIGELILKFSILIFSGAVALTLIQSLTALGMFKEAAIFSVIGVIVGLTITFGFTEHWGLGAVVAADLLANCCVAFAAYLCISRHNQRTSTGIEQGTTT